MESTLTMLARNLLTTDLSALSGEASHDAQAIKKELQIILDCLSDAEHHGKESNQALVELADTFRELAYDAEDSIDELMLCTERNRAGGYFERSKYLLRKPETHLRATKQLRMLRSQVTVLRSKLISINLAAASTSSKPVVDDDPPPSALDVHASTLVGMDGPRKELVRLLTEEEDQELASRLKVVSIVGLGGMGKTTLAAEVYKTTQAHFDCRAWVLMTPRSDMKKLFIDILHQVEDHSRGSHGLSDERDLITKIRQSLQDKRYLLVLDDIWSSETWEIIKSAFPFNSLGSRIITTTRSHQVASSCCSQWNDHIYHIRALSLQDSRMLFHKRIFGSVDNCPSDLEHVSHDIMIKCSGVPLALTVISGFLAKKPRITSIWESVYGSIAAAPESTGSIIRDMLLLCYDTLPNHLKMCLLYVSIFPEDYVLNYDSIVRGWIAEGLIKTDSSTSLQEKAEKTDSSTSLQERAEKTDSSTSLQEKAEKTDSSTSLQEKAENYLNELINRNMIQPVHDSDDGRPGAFQIHPLMLDLIRHKSSEQNFVTLIYNREPVFVSHRKIRRLSIISGSEGHGILASVDISHIRSLYIFGGVMPKLPFKHLTLLRVLNLNGCKGLKDHDIKEIAGLLLLRYLSIQETPINKLPVQIGRLQNLMTLDLRGTDVQELPSSFVKLQRLEHLLCDKMIFPVGIGKMAALRELVFWWFVEEKSRYETIETSLHKLEKLQSLSIHGDGSSVEFFNHLKEPLPQLKRIQLSGCCYLNWMPMLTKLLPSLTYLSIDIKEIKDEDIQLLSMLPSLIRLFVSSKMVPTEKIVIRSNGFPTLKEFQLHSVRADLKFEPQAMKGLETLLLSLYVLPEETYDFSISIDQFRCLKKIDIRIHGEGASELAKATDAAIRKAADKHLVVNIVALENLNDYDVKEGKETECKFHPSGSRTCP